MCYKTLTIYRTCGHATTGEHRCVKQTTRDAQNRSDRIQYHKDRRRIDRRLRSTFVSVLCCGPCLGTSSTPSTPPQEAPQTCHIPTAPVTGEANGKCPYCRVQDAADNRHSPETAARRQALLSRQEDAARRSSLAGVEYPPAMGEWTRAGQEQRYGRSIDAQMGLAQPPMVYERAGRDVSRPAPPPPTRRPNDEVSRSGSSNLPVYRDPQPVSHAKQASSSQTYPPTRIVQMQQSSPTQPSPTARLLREQARQKAIKTQISHDAMDADQERRDKEEQQRDEEKERETLRLRELVSYYGTPVTDETAHLVPAPLNIVKKKQEPDAAAKVEPQHDDPGSPTPSAGSVPLRSSKAKQNRDLSRPSRNPGREGKTLSAVIEDSDTEKLSTSRGNKSTGKVTRASDREEPKQKQKQKPQMADLDPFEPTLSLDDLFDEVETMWQMAGQNQE
ncbi:hypothetical protein Cob_v002666 [Colletotrichum orbiculare MAFF 240422]|uniref:Uncharacterized protein n=1 Tax=Colletotrichum orbiculare (strain 104-T / ATCC 96160 / CBS 514.97 / LARS 414 / MAFF 240422) TaxID=1213857 RepID=N4USF8_COLOR|nr:hypothetical protein Cob_v002666 [Colletotrichum orbiculare MAFF 240422]